MWKKNPLRPHENDEEVLSPKIAHLSAIEALTYITNYTQPDIARFNSSSTQRHWNRIKYVFRYLTG